MEVYAPEEFEDKGSDYLRVPKHMFHRSKMVKELI